MSKPRIPKITLILGTGGVGKTTLAASLGLLSAQQGQRTLIITIDPSKRLAQALGMDASSHSGETISVPLPLHLNTSKTGALFALIPNNLKTYHQFLHSLTQDQELLERLKKQPILKSFATEHSGANEYFALEVLDQAMRNDNYDHIILDTPPAQHASDFFEGPERLISLYKNRILARLLGKGSNILAFGMNRLLKLFKFVLGDGLFTTILDFAEVFLQVQQPLIQKMDRILNSLKAPEVSVSIVTRPHVTQIKEITDLLTHLRSKSIQVSTCYANMTHQFPPFSGRDPDDEAFLESAFAPEAEAIEKLRHTLHHPGIITTKSGEVLKCIHDFGPMTSGLEELAKISEILAK